MSALHCANYLRFGSPGMLPHRLQHGGVLVALQGKSDQQTSRSGRVGTYLRTVARQAHLNFLMAPRKLARRILATEEVNTTGRNGLVANGQAISRLLNGHQRNGHAVRMSIR